MEVVTTFAAARSLAAGRTGLVPTMGYLHEGHVSLLAASVAECDTTVMSLFVNPLQFDEAGDLDRYPRDLARDAAVAEAAGVAVVLAPDVGEVYPTWPPDTVVTLARLTHAMEGAHRPGHFDGVATVVAKLLAGVRPDAAYFGRKDAQQLVVVRALARDLHLGVDIRGLPIVREYDGLALSSRNVFLDGERRAAALSLHEGVKAAADLATGGERRADRLGAILQSAMAGAGVTPEYVAVAAQEDATILDEVDRPSFVAVAARVGEVRLIDNVHLDVVDGAVVADLGVRLSSPSMLYEGSRQ
jgi:pantoate--beta-alanine ligase